MRSAKVQTTRWMIAFAAPRSLGEAGAKRLRLLTPDQDASSGWLTCNATPTKGRIRLEFVVLKLKIWTIARLEAAST